MINKDEIKYSIENLKHRKTRSFLTVLSILIGITSIFALLSFGLGIQNYINEVGEEAGVNKLFIQAKGVGAPGTDPNFYLTQEDVDFVEDINGVDEITGLYSDAGRIEFKDDVAYAFLTGYDPEKGDFIEETFTVDIYDGRSLKEGDDDKVVLGYNYQVANKVLEKPLRVGNNIVLNDEEFEVLGFYEEIGNPSDDSSIYITKDAFERLFPEKADKYGWILVSSKPNVDPSELAETIEDRLRRFKDQDEGKEDFFVQTFEDALETFSNIINILNGVLIIIALISVVIATVNIMNTMYTAVLERTKEIGVMKSIGARNEVILRIFVFESGFLGFVGGIVGIILGYFAASIGGQIAAEAGYALLKPEFPWYLIVGCLAFATFVGIIAGLLPARQASKLRPVDALRYE